MPHPLTNMPPSGAVQTGVFWPDHPGKDKHFTAGKIVSDRMLDLMLIHTHRRGAHAPQVNVAVVFHNEGTEMYNVSVIMGSLNSPTDFSLHIQNFSQQVSPQYLVCSFAYIFIDDCSNPSGQVYLIRCDPGQEVTLDYKFVPDQRLEPRDFFVALTVFYTDAAGRAGFSNTFFNQTIEIVEVKVWIDTELIQMFIILAALAFLVLCELHAPGRCVNNSFISS